MIPLYIFPLLWLAFLVVYGAMSFISLLQMMRFGISGSGTWLSSLLFVSISVLVILGTGFIALSFDWTQTLDLTGIIGAPAIY